MTRVVFVGQDPKTVGFTDPALPPDLNAEKIQASIDLAATKMSDCSWTGDLCMISPDDAGIAMLEKQLGNATYDCVVIGGGMSLPPKSPFIFEKAVNAIHNATPRSAIAFNSKPEDTAEAAGRRLKSDQTSI